MKSIKVCHLTSVHNADDVRIFEKMCTSLAEAGHDVYLVAPGESYTKNGVRIVGLGKRPVSRAERMSSWAKKAYRQALEIDAEIYHFHDPELLPYAAKLRKKGKIVIYDSHENLPLQMMTKTWIPQYLRRLLSYVVRKTENFYAAKMSAVVVVSAPILKRFSSVNKNTVEICNFPLMREFTVPAPWESKFSEVCYIGGIFKERGIVEMLDMVADVPQVKFHLAGKFSPASLEEEVKSHVSWQHVEYHGFLDREGVTALLNRVKIGVVLLHKYKSYSESLPVKLFEYMAAGIPVIVTDFPLWERIVEGEKCGLCVDPYNRRKVAEAVEYLLQNDDIAQKMGENGRAAVLEKYNWEREKEKLFGLYARVLSVNSEV